MPVDEERAKRIVKLKKEMSVGEKLDPRVKENWRFRWGKRRWAFWLLIGAFVLFLITQYVVRRLV